MKKSINPEVITIESRFFEAFDWLISTGKTSGLKAFCEKHKLNRTKYSRIKNDMGKPIEEMLYKSIDLDALSWLCKDFGVSAEWLLLGQGDMLKSDTNAHTKRG